MNNKVKSVKQIVEMCDSAEARNEQVSKEE